MMPLTRALGGAPKGTLEREGMRNPIRPHYRPSRTKLALFQFEMAVLHAVMRVPMHAHINTWVRSWTSQRLRMVLTRSKE